MLIKRKTVPATTNKGRIWIMDNSKKPNHSIFCTVQQCANHAHNCDYCSLERVCIGTHEKNPTVTECTDCESFVLGKGCDKDCGCAF